MSSGEKQRKGRITKAGNARVRWLLVQVAVSMLRLSTPDTAQLRAWAERIAGRRGKKTAVVALARKLAAVEGAAVDGEGRFLDGLGEGGVGVGGAGVGDAGSLEPTNDQYVRGGAILWRLTVSAKVRGVDFEAEFELPIFGTGAARASSGAGW